MQSPVRTLPLLAALSVLGTAEAATLTVLVTDDAGRPLPNAVVILEPATGKLPVKPLAQVDIAQAKRQFNPALTVVTVGTPVNFPNFDTVRHHVYSFSPIKPFELKLYAGVPAAPIVFDKPGVAVLGCNIHDQMAAWVVVVDTPHYARTADNGEARLDNVPAGSYKLRGWQASVPEARIPAASALTVAAADLASTLRLPAVAP